MHRNTPRSPILYPGLVCLSLVLFLVPEAEVSTIRGHALSMLRPFLSLSAHSSNRYGPQVASIPVARKDAPPKTAEPPPQPEDYAQELDQLRANSIRYDSEIKHLRSALNLPSLPKDAASRLKDLPASVEADVIARKILWQEPILALDRGEKEGIRLHAGVLHRGAVAGRIVSVGPHVSCLALLTHRGVSITARLVDCRIEGVLQGSIEENGERLCRLAIVGREVSAKVGEQVVTSGYDGVFPPGLWLGAVTSVKKMSDVQWELCVRPACNDNAIEIVRVLTGDPPDIPWPPEPARRKKSQKP